jgi:hypothetical protein
MATTGELQNALEGLQAIAEAMEAALNQVGYGDTDEPGDGEDVSAGPFDDEQYMGALETVAALLEAGEGLLDGVGVADPDEVDDAPGRSTDKAGETVTAWPSDGLLDWRLGAAGGWKL